MSDKDEEVKDYSLQIVLLCLTVGVLFATFIFYGPLDHGDRCQPYHLRVPSVQARDAGHQRKMLEHEVKMMQLKIEKQKLENQLEPRIF